MWLQGELERVQRNSAAYEAQLGSLQIALDSLNVQIELLKRQQALAASLGVKPLRRPSLGELTAFLAKDTVSDLEYRKQQGIPVTVGNESFRIGYVCMNYAADLKMKAALAGLNISYVSINFIGYREVGVFIEAGHALNGALLSDGRWVWIEPQTDAVSFSLQDHLKRFYGVSSVDVISLAIAW